MTDSISEFRDALRGDVEPIRRFGVLIQVPWWRKTLQRRVMPGRYRRWVQAETLRVIEEEAGL
jgi:hypothetical protein